MTSLTHRKRRDKAILLVIVMSFFLWASGASAAVSASIQRGLTVSSVSWEAVATPTGTTPSKQSLVLTWNNQSVSNYQYFDVVNTGTIDVTGQIFNVTNILQGSGREGPLVTFDACLNGNWTAADTCSGTIMRLGTTAVTTFSSTNTPLIAGRRFAVQAFSEIANRHYTTTIAVTISRAQIRLGLTINS